MCTYLELQDFWPGTQATRGLYHIIIINACNTLKQVQGLSYQIEGSSYDCT